jgi:thiamine biosynthesis lipoprotein
VSLSLTNEPTSLTPVFDRFAIWGTSAVVGVTSPASLGDARRLLDEELVAIEEAASRFRPGTEILALNASAGTGPVKVSANLMDLVNCSIAAAELTAGACDPTVASSLIALGYDTDFDRLVDVGDLDRSLIHAAPGISGIVCDPEASTVSLPEGVTLDLGATAKARAADRAAVRIATTLGVGTIVDLGGDLRIAGSAPSDGWQVGITDEARSGRRSSSQEVVAVNGGAIASSSSGVRRWRRGDEEFHHVIDPTTGWPAVTPWRLATVAAATCVEANAFSTAALVWGNDALFELPQRSLAARLVNHDGAVERIGGWPLPAEEGTDR